MLVQVTEEEARVLDLRGVEPSDAGTALYAPAWAAYLAEAEVFDSEKRYLPWTQVWDLAFDDSAWRASTNALASKSHNPRDPFFRSWVDSWLARNIGMRVYPADPEGDRALRRVRR